MLECVKAGVIEGFVVFQHAVDGIAAVFAHDGADCLKWFLAVWERPGGNYSGPWF